ncbi:MAG: hypothetical protein QW292_08315 [Candidatus Parvarchaeota archaeon]
MLNKISMLSSIDASWGRVYLYKQREDVEQAFGAMNDELGNDKPYLPDDYALRGTSLYRSFYYTSVMLRLTRS